jgi:hypothetical protein
MCKNPMDVFNDISSWDYQQRIPVKAEIIEA